VSGAASGRRNGGPDGGSATVLAAAAVGVLVCLLGLGLQLGAATLARHRAEDAADLAALAGAHEAVRGADVACARAGAVAQGNGARLVDCVIEGWAVAVIAVVPCRCVPSVSGDAAGRARAGPAAPLGDPSGAPPVTGGDRREGVPG
jgi:secretion/DNA translocation related TadE-like protein